MSIFPIKVEETFLIEGRGLILAPFIPVEENLPASAKIILEFPNGEIFETEAIFEVPHIKFLTAEDRMGYKTSYQIVLEKLTEDQVPVGTVIRLK